MKKNIILFLVVIFVIIGVILIWQYWPQQTEQELSGQEQAEVDQPAAQEAILDEKIDETTNWQTYRDIGYGFDLLKYPKDWVILNEGRHDADTPYAVSFIPQDLKDNYIGAAPISIMVKTIQLEEAREVGETVLFISDIRADVGGIVSEKQILGGPEEVFGRILVPKEPELVYVLTYSNLDFEEVFNQMISTIQFDNTNSLLLLAELASNYDMFGRSEFSTRVSGYVELKDTFSGEGGDIPVTIPYFVVTKFYDPEFQVAINAGLDEGNTVNTKEGGLYKFNLGCFENNTIEGIEYEPEKEYINEETAAEILASSEDNQIDIVLFFGFHGGSGCVCCNLAHQIQIYQED